MSIDARIAGLTLKGNDDCREITLTLEDRGPMNRAGQGRLTVLNDAACFNDLAMLIGCEIWGCGSQVILGDTRLAAREGYTGLRLVEGWQAIVKAYRTKKEMA